MVFTGLGEPTRRLEVLLDARAPAARGRRRRAIRVDTDGLASLREGCDVPPLLAAAGVDAVSVSLNAPDAATYARICPSRYGEAAYDAVKAFIRSAVAVHPGRGGERGRAARALGAGLPRRRRVARSALPLAPVRPARPGRRRRRGLPRERG